MINQLHAQQQECEKLASRLKICKSDLKEIKDKIDVVELEGKYRKVKWKEFWYGVFTFKDNREKMYIVIALIGATPLFDLIYKLVIHFFP